ncbi:DUF4169 family protein [Roseomonas sp. BN140053]|uniref:DUF4169 family protein n=1 Tax=Roseomonas sp. BN140053 TaxID=3391898 RepID=UPI0039E942F0
MAEIVNLNRFRRNKAKAEKSVQAAANRVSHGRTGAEKAADRQAAERRAALLDGARRDDVDAPGGDEPPPGR